MEGGMCKKGRGRSKAVEGVRAGGGRELQDKRKKEEKIKNQVLDYKWRKKEDLKQTTEEMEKLLLAFPLTSSAVFLPFGRQSPA